MDRTRLSYITALAIGTTTLVMFAWWWWRQRKNYKLPSKWRKVGELSNIFVFPVKSLGCIRETAIECTQLGCKSGWLRDRTLMVIDLSGKFVTGRQIPRMVQVTPSVAGSVLTLRAPGMMTISTDLAQIGSKSFKASVWNQSVPACDCGEEVARWLSRFLLQEDTGLRLVYYPLDGPYRDVRKQNRGFPLTENADVGAYPDATAYTLMNEASINDLNTRIEDPVTPLQFRPNFVVKGAEPLEEDSWDWIKIGGVLFRNVKPCTRCIFTTVDPDLGVKHPKMEPFKTLRKYRQMEDPFLRTLTGDVPVMGVHMGLKGPNGVVRIGDPVYVGVAEEDNPPVSPP
ncbi:mitochondrial amidoxime-reducing component 1-like [Microplitis mediator]|uniref:mitochondrial amidoxime-reducing component 1-like n=1 Tax=Microplitis mediator TaxID=375433 RepID=UPI002556637A|nr:mitochondrial amidoxime-reducing component 1-like [Microplitis mediator]